MTQVITDHSSHYQDQAKPKKPNSPYEMLAAIKRKFRETDLSFSSDILSLSSEADGNNLGSEDGILSRSHTFDSYGESGSSMLDTIRSMANSRGSASGKLSLTEIAKAQSASTANAKRRRRTITIASSPTNGSQRVRRSVFQSADISHSTSASGTNPNILQIPIHPQLKHGSDVNSRRSMLYQLRAMSGRISRLPKRNLKPLDFSNIKKQKDCWRQDSDTSGSGSKKHQPHLFTQSSPSLSGAFSPTIVPSLNLSQSQDSDKRQPLSQISAGSDNGHASSKGPLHFLGLKKHDTTQNSKSGQENLSWALDQNMHPDSGIGTEKAVSKAIPNVSEKKNSAKQSKKASSKANQGKNNVCKYCGKQYRYRSKLKSHEQHCSSKLEALLYSQGDVADQANSETVPQEGQIVSCVCGPRHTYSRIGIDSPSGGNNDLDAQEMIQCTACSCWLHRICVSLVQGTLPNPYTCPNCIARVPHMVSTTKSQPTKSNGQPISPESQRLAALLADVTDTSETEDEDPAIRAAMIHNKRIVAKPEVDSDGTMSLTDASELVRFHRQGKAPTRRSRKIVGDTETPDNMRLIRSDADFMISNPPTRSRTFDNLHTDNILSSDADFLGLSMLFPLDGGAQNNQQAKGNPPVVTNTTSGNINSTLASDPPIQWHIENMPIVNPVASTANGAVNNTQIGGQQSLGGDLSLPMNMDLASFLNQSSHGPNTDMNNVYSELMAPESVIPDVFSSLATTSNAPAQEFYPSFSMGQFSYANNVPVPRVAGKRGANNNGNMIEHGSSSTITIMNDNFSDLLMTSRAPMSDSEGGIISKSYSQSQPNSSTGHHNNELESIALANSIGMTSAGVSAPISSTMMISQSHVSFSQPPTSANPNMIQTSLGNVNLGDMVSATQISQVYQDIANGHEIFDKELEGLINFDL
ncbi:hypothetical protein H4219_000293 [Mycoemilia scoparia]|uniref:Uncharacterized protein n=1 Tax=Mycoemilia scoparia TaxID=417184 RepID=A0A9W8A9G5_9FUNG|nr:hypothetical protein H4219_000293 [Mycoemilia scoparia]